MAMSNQPKGINAFTIGNINPYLVDCTIERWLNVTNSSESFIPIQRIINDKVKRLMIIQKKGNYGIYKKKKNENISFNYDRTESDLTCER
jgi:topoisomerase IA-like protein